MLPNIRKVFIPDEGYTFFDIDLDSADLRIVTYEADCKGMKEMFAAGLKPYVEIAKEYYKDPTITKHHPKYKAFKSFAHGTNYLGLAKNLAGRTGLLVHEAEQTQSWYFQKFPEIKKWQEHLIDQINRIRRVSNAFGYHITFTGKVTSNTYNEAVAWIPQSSVAILINHAYVNIYNQLPEVQVLLQVHDSLAGQYPTDKPHLVQEIVKCSEIIIPYADPLVIPVGVKVSAESWGACG